MWQIHSIWVEVWSSGMIGAKSQKALIYNPGSSKDLCGLNVLVFLLNRNKKKGGGKGKKPQCVFHIHHTVTAKPIKNCTTNCVPGRLAVLCSTNMQHNSNPRLFWWISRSGHFACHSPIHALHVSLIKTEWFWLHFPIFRLKALKRHLLGSYQHGRCKAQSCIWEAIPFPRGQGIHTEQKKNSYLVKFPFE